MTQKLPANGCLLIMQHENTTQAQLVQCLGRAFQAQGRFVFVLKVKSEEFDCSACNPCCQGVVEGA